MFKSFYPYEHVDSVHVIDYRKLYNMGYKRRNSFGENGRYYGGQRSGFVQEFEFTCWNQIAC